MQLRHVSAYLFKSMRRGYNSGLSAGGQPIPHPLFASTCHQPVQGAHQLVAVAGVVQEGGGGIRIQEGPDYPVKATFLPSQLIRTASAR